MPPSTPRWNRTSVDRDDLVDERLFIAGKTAAVHVSNILAKLGTRSRTEIAAWAIRTGVADLGVERAG